MWCHGTVQLGDLPHSVYLFGEMSHRLFADRKTLTPLGEAHEFLRKVSKWRGASSRRQSACGIWWEYEIPESKLSAVIGALTLLLGSHMSRRNAFSPIENPIEILVRDLMQEVVA